MKREKNSNKGRKRLDEGDKKIPVIIFIERGIVEVLGLSECKKIGYEAIKNEIAVL